MPIEMRGKGSIAEAVKRYADRRDSDSDSEDDNTQLTPEQILAQHQEIPREPHVGIFLGVEDPTPAREEKKNTRCGADARDMAEAMGKLDYRTFSLHDHKSHKTASDGSMLPTRMNLAHLLRTLKDGKYDEQTRRKPNLAEWSNCLVYLASRVRITTYGEGKSETMEFLMRQESMSLRLSLSLRLSFVFCLVVGFHLTLIPSPTHLHPHTTVEQDPVWIDMVELINKISDIPFGRLFVMLGMW